MLKCFALHPNEKRTIIRIFYQLDPNTKKIVEATSLFSQLATLHLYEKLRIEYGLCYHVVCEFYCRRVDLGYVINIEIAEDVTRNITADRTTTLIANEVQNIYDFINNKMTEDTLTHLIKYSKEKYLKNSQVEFETYSIEDFKDVFKTNNLKKISIQVQSEFGSG